MPIPSHLVCKQLPVCVFFCLKDVSSSQGRYPLAPPVRPAWLFPLSRDFLSRRVYRDDERSKTSWHFLMVVDRGLLFGCPRPLLTPCLWNYSLFSHFFLAMLLCLPHLSRSALIEHVPRKSVTCDGLSNRFSTLTVLSLPPRVR